MNNDLIPKVQPSLLDIRMDSKTFPRLCRYDHDEAVRQMALIVSKAMMYRGQTADSVGITLIASSLVDELLQENRWGARYLSLEEIEIVVKRAVLEGDIYISVASLYKAVIEYCKGEGHRVQQEAAELKRRQESESIRNSVVAPMLQSYTGKFIKNSKIR